MALCDCFTDGQEIVIDDYSGVPDGFCAWAWADICRDIMTVAMGADMPGIKQPGTIITGCRDWFRPVIFKVERIADGCPPVVRRGENRLADTVTGGVG